MFIIVYTVHIIHYTLLQCKLYILNHYTIEHEVKLNMYMYYILYHY